VLSKGARQGWFAALAWAGLMAAATTSGARSDPLPTRAYLPVQLAQRAAVAAMEKCEADGYRVSAAVVDDAGLLKAQVRADGAGPHTLDSSRRKAYTAASLREATGRLAALVAQRPALQSLRDMNASILILGGGFPIEIQGQVVGAIGVGGAPGDKLDEACARAGLRAIGARPYGTEAGE
jgi:uncharacterized protein GlcG (DUF336 family)